MILRRVLVCTCILTLFATVFHPSDLSTRSDLHPSLQTQSLLADEQPDDYIRVNSIKRMIPKGKKRYMHQKQRQLSETRRKDPRPPNHPYARQNSRLLACPFLRLMASVAMRHWSKLCGLGHTGDGIQSQARCIRHLRERAGFEHVL
jgi:hypothetical protein